MIKIAFTDFWNGFDINNNYFVEILSKITEFEIIDIKKEKHRNREVEFLFYSVFGYDYLEFNCVRIFYTGENIVPDFNLCDYAIGYENMQLQDRYVRVPLYAVHYRDDLTLALECKKKIKTIDSGVCDRQFCAMVVSNGVYMDKFREDLFWKLSDYKRVDSGGKYLNNIGCPDGVGDKLAFLGGYKFSFAIENVSHPGYCTEKIIQSFAANTVPIYWGDPNVAEYFDEDSFVNCMRMNSMEEIISYIQELDMSNEKYLAMLNANPFVKSKNISFDYSLELERFLRNIISLGNRKGIRRNSAGSMRNYELKVANCMTNDYEKFEKGKLSWIQRKKCLRMFLEGKC